METYQQKRERVLQKLRVTRAPIPDEQTLEQMIAAEPDLPTQEPTREPTVQERIEKNAASIKQRQSVPSAFGPALSDEEIQKAAYVPERKPDTPEPVSTETSSEPSSTSTETDKPAKETGVDPKSPLGQYQEQVRSTGANVAVQANTGNPNDPMDRRKSEQILREMTALSNNKELMRGSPPDTRQSLDEALEKARELYQQQATKNEWLELAQILSRAVVQFGAASVGGEKTDMTNINAGVPTVDYNARTSRAFGEYQDSIRSAYNRDDRDRQQWKDKSDERKEEYGKQWDVLEKRLQTARDEESDRERTRSGNNVMLREEIKQLNDREDFLNNQLIFRQTLINQLAQEDDLTSKSRKKNEEKYGATAARAGIHWDQLQAELDGVPETSEGTWFGTKPDKKAQQAVLKTKIDEISKKLADIEKRKRELGVINLPEETKQTQQTPPSTGKIRVRVKSTGQTGTLDAKDFDPSKYEKIE
jgi:hypothetical protein